jgi:hypothetical protein
MELELPFLSTISTDQDWEVAQASLLQDDIHFYHPELFAKQVECDIQPGEAGGAFDQSILPQKPFELAFSKIKCIYFITI